MWEAEVFLKHHKSWTEILSIHDLMFKSTHSATYFFSIDMSSSKPSTKEHSSSSSHCTVPTCEWEVEVFLLLVFDAATWPATIHQPALISRKTGSLLRKKDPVRLPDEAG